MFKKLKIKNLLSFGNSSKEILFNEGLNVVIGANGSGKSNLIKILKLLKDSSHIYEKNFLWKGKKETLTEASLEVIMSSFKYEIKLSEENREIKSFNENFFKENGTRMSKCEISLLKKNYKDIRIYQSTIPEFPQLYDYKDKYLMEDFSNLGRILNFLQKRKDRNFLLNLICEVVDGIKDFKIRVKNNLVELYFKDDYLDTIMYSNEVSNGVLKFLCLIAILQQPKLPPLVCIENPEAELHFDVIPVLSDLLKETGKRTQMIITTNSADLLDNLSDVPETILVCDKLNGSTQINPLCSTNPSIKEFIDEYGLGKLWSRGDIGGCRW